MNKVIQIVLVFCMILFKGIPSSAIALPENWNGDFWKNQMTYFAVLQNKNLNDSELVNKALDKLFQLQEVKRKNKFIDSLTKHTKGISMRVMQKPSKLTKYYWIAVGYDNDLRFETYYNFYVYPDNMSIRYLDTYSGDAITLMQWRKKRKLKKG
ncbi:MAG TPA: hypothetical protein VK563_00180 [Puia sp.]|nr:hypothetical protein [Puia sp.]